MTSYDDERSVESALWDGALAFVDGLPESEGGTSRGVGDFNEDGAGGSSVTTTYKISQRDGTQKVYEITVSVVESLDTIDWFWGPGGTRDQDDPARRVVVDGRHYLIGDDKPGGFKGYGGSRFEIAFFDGRKVTTRDLWHQGTIPPKWRERFPNNARFAGDDAP